MINIIRIFKRKSWALSETSIGIFDFPKIQKMLLFSEFWSHMAELVNGLFLLFRLRWIIGIYAKDQFNPIILSRVLSFVKTVFPTQGTSKRKDLMKIPSDFSHKTNTFSYDENVKKFIQNLDTLLECSEIFKIFKPIDQLDQLL